MIHTPHFPPSKLSSPHLMGDIDRPLLGLGWELRTVELLEVSPPPRRNPSSILPSSSSGYASTSSSESDSTAEGGNPGSESDSASSSYCSSDDEEEADVVADVFSPDVATRRVLAWRASFSESQTTRPEAQQLQFSPTASPRTSPTAHYDRGTQVVTTVLPPSPAAPALSLSGAIYAWCTACDTSFRTLQLYQQHGNCPDAPEACRAAVSYGLEPQQSPGSVVRQQATEP